MNRFVRPLALAVLLAAGTGHAVAQDYRIGWNPRTGDVWVDSQLADINRYGTRYREPFIDEMVRYQGAPRDLVTDLLTNRRWAPGDVYYACSIARAAGRPCAEVADEWERDHGQGWGVVAQRMGIKPGSAEFHALKKGFVPTYDRWGRPITLDRDLERAYPNRGKSTGKRGAGTGHVHSDQAGAKHTHATGSRKATGKPTTRAANKPAGKSTGKPAGKGKPTGAGNGKGGGAGKGKGKAGGGA